MQSLHRNDNFLCNCLLQNVNDLFNQLVTRLEGFLSYSSQCLDLRNVQISMASGVELVVNLEEPGVHVEVVRN